MTMCATPSAAQSSVEAGDNVCAGVPPRLTPWRPTGVPLGVLAADDPGDIGAPSRPSATPLFLFPFFFFPMINYHTRTHMHRLVVSSCSQVNDVWTWVCPAGSPCSPAVVAVRLASASTRSGRPWVDPGSSMQELPLYL